jgi:NADPH:quinone reductase-like Zn-dependent oxidoreductase
VAINKVDWKQLEFS